MRTAYAFILAACLLVPAASTFAANIDWSKVDRALGKPGADQPGGVHKYSLPRTDLRVTVDGVPIMPQFALGSWLAFEPMDTGAMMMGDLVLTGQEVGPVMAKLLAGGITVTALHNHLLRAEPAPFYMHVGGEGDPVRLAGAVHDALQASQTPFGTPQKSATPPTDLEAASLDRILGYKGHRSGEVYQYAIPRADTITEDGRPVSPAMGTATSINFEPLGDGRAAITGDLVLLAGEVGKVLGAMREHGIEITAVHNHMLDEQPRVFFVHYWAVDNAETLARGLRTALSLINLAAPA